MTPSWPPATLGSALASSVPMPSTGRHGSSLRVVACQTESRSVTGTPLSNSALGNGGPSDYSNSSVYQAPSGAWVFAAGTIAWSWGLDNFNGYNFADPRIQQTTANVLNAFLTGVAPTITTFTPESGPVGTSVTIEIGRAHV